MAPGIEIEGNEWRTWDQQYGDAQITKWHGKIDLAVATDNEFREYTNAKLYEYADCLKEEPGRRAVGTGRAIFYYFYEEFGHFTAKDFDRLGHRYLENLKRQLRKFDVYVAQRDDITVAQCLVNATLEEYRKWTEGDAELDVPIPPKAPKLTVDAPSTPAPRAPPIESTVDDVTKAPIDLPFASFRQEPIALHLQTKELLEERQQRLGQQHQKRARNQPEERRKRPQNRPKPQRTSGPEPIPKRAYQPQPSTCRRCQENFNSRNVLFRHLKLCKTSRSRASSVSRVSRASSTSSTTSSRAYSVTSKSSASSVSSKVSRASSKSSVSSVSSTSSIASIEKAQLRILGQLYTLRSQNLPFLRRNNPGIDLKTSRPPVKTTLFTDHLKPDSYVIDSCLTPKSIVNAPRAPPVKSTVDVPKDPKTSSKNQQSTLHELF